MSRNKISASLSQNNGSFHGSRPPEKIRMFTDLKILLCVHILCGFGEMRVVRDTTYLHIVVFSFGLSPPHLPLLVHLLSNSSVSFNS